MRELGLPEADYSKPHLQKNVEPNRASQNQNGNMLNMGSDTSMQRITPKLAKPNAQALVIASSVSVQWNVDVGKTVAHILNTLNIISFGSIARSHVRRLFEGLRPHTVQKVQRRTHLNSTISILHSMPYILIRNSHLLSPKDLSAKVESP